MEEIDWAKALRNKDGTTRRNASDMSVLLFFSGAQHGSFVRKGCLPTILRFRGKCCSLRVWFSWLANKVWIGCTSLRRCHVMLSYTLNGPSQRWSFNIFQPNFFKVSTNWRCTKHIYAIWIQPLSASWRQILIIIFISFASKVCWVFGWMNLIWTVYLLERIKRCCSWTCWLSFYLSAVFSARFWSQESHGGRCGLHRASRVMGQYIRFTRVSWLLGKNIKSLLVLQQVVKRLNQNNHQTESMTFWWIPLDKPLWGGLRSSYLT